MIAIMSFALESHLRAAPGYTRSFAQGQFLFHLGDKVNVIHFIEEGAVHLIRHPADGAVLVLQRAGPSSIVAEASLYSDAYHCDAVAQAPTRSFAVSKKEIKARFAASPAFAQAWARHLAHEVQRTRLQAEILSLQTVAARLDAWIAWKDGRVPVKGESRAIASQIGVSAEALYRELGKRRSDHKQQRIVEGRTEREADPFGSRPSYGEKDQPDGMYRAK